MTRLKRYIPMVILISMAIIAWYLGLHHSLSFAFLRTHHASLESFLAHYPLTSIVLYMAVYIAIVGLSIPGATFMTLLGGLLFGQWIGTTSVVISATIGATILFVSAKLASQDLLSRKAGGWVDKMKVGFQENAFNYLLTLRLIPVFPFVAINLVAALLQIPLRTFVLATFFGIIPGSFIYVSIGNSLSDVIFASELSPKVILEPKLLLALVGLGILSLSPVLYKRFHKG